MSSPASDASRVYAVHVRFDAHPPRSARRVDWAEPPLGLGRHRGRYEVIGQSADLDGLVRWVLSFGARVEVVGPEVLRRRVAREARRIAARHDGPSPGRDVKKR